MSDELECLKREAEKLRGNTLDEEGLRLLSRINRVIELLEGEEISDIISELRKIKDLLAEYIDVVHILLETKSQNLELEKEVLLTLQKYLKDWV